MLLAMGLVANAANEPNTVYQVTDSVAVSEDVDYRMVGIGNIHLTFTHKGRGVCYDVVNIF